jgi:hypothetical protein
VCIRPITIYSDQYCGFLFTCPVCFSYSSMVWRKGAGGVGGWGLSRVFFWALQVLLGLHTEMIRRVTQQQRPVEYIHMRCNTPAPSFPCFLSFATHTLHQSRFPGSGQIFVGSARDEWNRVGAKTFFRDFIALYFRQCTISSPFQPISIIVFVTNWINRNMNFIKLRRYHTSMSNRLGRNWKGKIQPAQITAHALSS